MGLVTKAAQYSGDCPRTPSVVEIKRKYLAEIAKNAERGVGRLIRGSPIGGLRGYYSGFIVLLVISKTDGLAGCQY